MVEPRIGVVGATGAVGQVTLDLLRERGSMAGTDLSAITGLTSGAITGVVARLEQAGYLRREPDPHDGRKQILHLALERAHIQDVINPLREDVAALLEKFDTHQLTAIAVFLAGTTDLVYRHAALLRAETISALGLAAERYERTPPTQPSEKSEMKAQR